MKKILEAITFLSLAMGLMLNTSVVYAAKHEQCKKEEAKDGYFTEPWKDWKGTDFYTEYLSHDLVELLANIDNKENTNYNAACISIATGIGLLAGGAAGGAIAGGIVALVRSTFSSEGDKMLLESAKNSYCGIKIHFWRDIFGKWHYYKFEAQ